MATAYRNNVSCQKISSKAVLEKGSYLMDPERMDQLFSRKTFYSHSNKQAYGLYKKVLKSHALRCWLILASWKSINKMHFMLDLTMGASLCLNVLKLLTRTAN
jgi:hypothetical protein